ncbi:MAG: MotA/TolQ/ExbB proton channel family protein [Planctomycetaceae bacterium]|nr:MotA/TolQ/ExbB proton channel family protein [Planctomycetaceae bacterium]MDO4424945.1 MotA/TolQ/ExbB proton channel family protein [Planctomycetia bacterium]
MLEIIASGGLVGLVIFLLSVTAVAFAVRFFMSLRQEKIFPEHLVNELQENLANGQLQAANNVCVENPSPLAKVVSMGLLENDGDWSDIEKTLEDAISDQASRLFRKIEILSVIGTIAPMLGLLGTVLGMITAFQQIAATQGSAQGPELARGIYQALVTTVEGLIVAIPSIGLFAYFRNRIDQMMAEMTTKVQQIFLPLKRYRRRVANSANWQNRSPASRNTEGA